MTELAKTGGFWRSFAIHCQRNVLDMAVGVIAASAFGEIFHLLVNDIW